MTHLRSRRDVHGIRNSGWPTGGDAYGHGVPIVLSERESRLHGEVGQVGGWKQAESLDYVKCGDGSEGVLPGNWRAGCRERGTSGSGKGSWKSTV